MWVVIVQDFLFLLSWAKRVADMPQQLWPVGFFSALGRSKEALSPLGSVVVVCLYFFLVVGMVGVLEGVQFYVVNNRNLCTHSKI